MQLWAGGGRRWVEIRTKIQLIFKLQIPQVGTGSVQLSR